MKIKKIEFLKYSEAIKKVRKLYPKVTTKAKWTEISKKNSFPKDLPKNPFGYYKGKGWIDWGHWLGTNKSRKKPKPKYMPYSEAEALLAPLRILTAEAYYAFKRSPEFSKGLPKAPKAVYQGRGWIGWSDYLTTPRESHISKERAEKNLLASKALIKDYGGKLISIEHPVLTIQCKYRHTPFPIIMSKFLNRKSWCPECNSSVGEELTRQIFQHVTGYRFKKVRKGLPFLKYGKTYLELDGYSSELKMAFEFQSEFHNNPKSIERDRIKSLRCKENGIDLVIIDFFDRTNDLSKAANDIFNIIAKRIPCVNNLDSFKPDIERAIGLYWNYKQAKKYIKKHKPEITTMDKFKVWTLEDDFPVEIPKSPDKFYRNLGWTSSGDFFSTGRVSNALKIFVSYQEASDWAKKTKIKSSTHWTEFSSKRPVSIPADPDKQYRNKGWVSWNEFLGVNNRNNLECDFLSYEESKQFLSELGINSTEKYKKARRKGLLTDLLPYHPDRSFDEWIDWPTFFGKEKRSLLNYDEARKYVLKNSIKSSKQYRDMCEAGLKPAFLPTHPDRHYVNKGWVDWPTFCKK